ncbi:molybdenum cofactor guanylyltransferase [Planctomicrobium sp. SH661]|uniref:molybdenum cofactor guanylyltransferase n=1 Tax=Planctomicrobium sp. SH661 TaxID=3448124 RepID=UPI003F5AEB20
MSSDAVDPQSNQKLTAERPAGLKIAGIVLCGGRSRRMGRSKASLPFGNETALQRIVRTVRQVTAPVVVVGSTEMQQPALPEDVIFIRDADPFQGPLSGFMTGLKRLSGEGDAVFLTGCDVPLLRPEVIELLAVRLTDDVDMAVVDDGERLQPLLAVYRASVLVSVEEMLRSEERSLQALLKRHQLRVVKQDELTVVDPELDCLRGMNTPEEYNQLLGLLESRLTSR